MDVEAPRGLLRVFDELEDPRVERNKLHGLADILAITLLAVICGADEWTEIELFGQSKLCLLYTSPSPRDQRGSRMPSSA